MALDVRWEHFYVRSDCPQVSLVSLDQDSLTSHFYSKLMLLDPVFTLDKSAAAKHTHT